MGQNTTPLRPEAGPLELEQLSISQLKVILNVLKSIREAVHDLQQQDDSHHQQALTGLDLRRSNRTAFLSGDAGAGKTTIYTTIRERLQRPAQGAAKTSADKKQEQADTQNKTITQEKKASHIKEINIILGESRGSVSGSPWEIVWLEPLDLEPMADSTNFLASVLVRIEKTYEKGSTGERRSRELPLPGFGAWDADDSNALMKLRRFQSELAMSWDGNLRSRAARIEPDTFAAEVLRSEKARMSVNTRLQEILSKLPSRTDSKTSPLFILPVDDVYLNPHVSMELLRLLRMISAPQLFLLLMGDYDSLEYLFYQQTLGDLVRLAGEHTFRARPEQQHEVPARAKALAGGMVRKMLPPEQVFEVEPLEIDEALGIKPPKRRASSKFKTLGELLEKFPFSDESSPMGKRNLRQFLDSRWEWEKSGEEKTSAPMLHPYTGAQLFEMPPRHAVDLWMKLSRETETEPSTADPTLALAGSQWRAALDEQNRLDLDDLEVCEELVRFGRDSIYDYELDTSKVEASIDTTPSLKPVSLGPSMPDLQVRPLVQWHFARTSKRDPAKRAPAAGDTHPTKDTEDRRLEIPPRPRGWLTLLHDFLALTRKQNLHGGSLLQPLKENDESRENHHQTCWAYVNPSAPDKKQVHWRAPAWEDFWHFDHLRQAWNRLQREGTGGAPVNAGWYAFRWIEAIAALLNPVPNELKLTPSTTERPAAEQWKVLAENVEALAAFASTTDSTSNTGAAINPKRELIKGWLANLQEMVLAKAGIPDEAIQHFGEQKTLQSLWNRPSPQPSIGSHD